MFAKVRNGEIRILMGSTQKMGAGTNVQKKLIALHDLDVPWRPADLEQRAGKNYPDREMKIRTKAVYIFTVILQKIPLMPTFGKLLKTSKSLFPR